MIRASCNTWVVSREGLIWGAMRAECTFRPVSPWTRRGGTGCYANGTQWATNVQSSVYWSSTINASAPTAAWGRDLFSGDVSGGIKTLNLYGWPVGAGR